MSTGLTLQVRVARKAVEALDIVTLELEPAEANQRLPAFSAGSHIDVLLTDSAGRSFTRQYSLCNDPAESHRYVIGVLRDPASRGGSRSVHEHVHEGDLLTISTPRNHFALATEARRHLLLAGGIGVTPLLCMAERLAHTGADFTLHYATRSAERTAFRARLQSAPYAGRVHLHHDDGPEAQKLDIAALLAQPEPGTHLYVCGPRGFMDAVLATARTLGWPEAQLHYEFFGAQVAASDADGAFEVKLARSGRVIPVAKEQTVTQALSAAGIDVMVSCEQGVCGTCLTRVIEGVPEHKDSYLTPDEQAANDQFTPCCSRSKTPLLVLDL